MKVNISIELTPELIETLDNTQLKDIIYQFLAIEAESKVKNKVNISANAEAALNTLESTKEAINDIITKNSADKELISIPELEKHFDNAKAADINQQYADKFHPEIIVDTPIKKLRKVEKTNEFIKNKKGESIPMADIIALYKNGISIGKICFKYSMNYTTVYTRLERLNIIVKKKS